MDKLHALGDQVIIEPDAGEKESPGGILIPESAQKRGGKPLRGRIVAVGPGKRHTDGRVYPVSVRVGWSVIYSKYDGYEFTHERKDYKVVPESGVLVVVEETR